MVHRGYYPRWHFGFGYGWGWFVDYPLDDIPDMGGLLDLPGGADFDMPMDAFDAPMIDPGFAADPFGW